MGREAVINIIIDGESMPKCPNCGFTIMEGVPFCSNCGISIKWKPDKKTRDDEDLEDLILMM